MSTTRSISTQDENELNEIKTAIRDFFAPRPVSRCNVTRDDHWCTMDTAWEKAVNEWHGRKIRAEQKLRSYV